MNALINRNQMNSTGKSWKQAFVFGVLFKNIFFFFLIKSFKTIIQEFLTLLNELTKVSKNVKDN